MFPSLRGFISWKPIKAKSSRRSADGIEPRAIIDLTVEIDPHIRQLAEENEDLYMCPICYEAPEEPVATMCGHIFCHSCLVSELQPFNRCPMCRKLVPSYFRIYF
ncbi:uncharacterized protein LOC108033114 [Drosophila biarmipes]|uniref:uncharacterized protein LOC108033114 n=1 Tax=Drosophila biarmipes TaxID=125945 RepID=UPI0007E5EF1B|nr:uncharacterized protein LOC108033114 [Drosophila biarmipes]